MRFAWLFLVFLMAVCACSPKPPQAQTSIQATLDDSSIRPGLSRIPAGQLITLRLSNLGSRTHTWVLLKDPPGEPFGAKEEANLLFQVSLEPGESRTLEFRAPAAPGEYSVASSLPGDLEKGLAAKILVVQPGY